MTIRELAKQTQNMVNNDMANRYETYYGDGATGGKALLIWKTGRSWQYKVLESYRADIDAMSEADYDLYLQARAIDPRAFFVTDNVDIPRPELYWNAQLSLDDLADGYRRLHDRTDPDTVQTCKFIEAEANRKAAKAAYEAARHEFIRVLVANGYDAENMDVMAAEARMDLARVAMLAA